MDLPGFSIRMVHFDIMHARDLGILQLALPSALFELVHAGVFCTARGVNEQLKAATCQYRKWCRANGVTSRARRFTKAWVKLPDPQIGMVHAKAAATRSMQAWMCAVCHERATAVPSLHAHMRWGLFWHLCSADRVTRRARRHLKPHEREQLAQRVEAALRCYKWLHGHAQRSGIPIWKLIPKHHAMTHIGFDALGVNPRFVQCYKDEDMVGKFKRIYTSCHARTAPRRSLERYLLGQCAHWFQVLEQVHPAMQPRPKRQRPAA